MVGFNSWGKHRTCINMPLSLSSGWADRRLDPLNISRVDVCLVTLVNLRELGWRHWFSRSLSWVQTRVLSGDMGACPFFFFFFFLAGVSPAFHFPVFLETVPPNKARSIGYSTWPHLLAVGVCLMFPGELGKDLGESPARGGWQTVQAAGVCAMKGIKLREVRGEGLQAQRECGC